MNTSYQPNNTFEKAFCPKRKKGLALFILLLSLGALQAQSGGWDASATNGVSGYTDHGNGVIQLLSTASTGCAAAAIHETSSTYNPTTSDFNQCYQVYFGCLGNDNIGSDSKGDGLAFSFWKNSATYNINNGSACGGGLGYMGSASDGKMITIEFDTWSSQGNSGFDASYGGGGSGINDEIALQRDGTANDGGRITSTNAGNLEDGLEHTVCITYNRTTHILLVTIDGVTKLSSDLTGSPYELGAYFGNTGLNQTWSSGKFGATNAATVSKGADISDNAGAALNQVTVSLANQTVCSGTSATFDAGGGYTSYAWSANGSGGAQTSSGTAAGNYTVTVTNAAGCSGVATGVLTVDATTVGGSVTADATVCSGSNGATLTLAGHTGSIVKWQSSTDNFVTPVDIANVTTTQTYTNLVSATKYRAVVKSGLCASANSAAATITIDPATVAGSVTADATVCSGSNGATLTLAGHTGSIVKWQRSTDNFVTPVDIANVTTTQTYSNITATTKYRAVVKSGTCASANSAAVTITVDPATVAGSVTADATVCSGANGATLTLAGHTGSIVKWQSSTDNFVTPVDIANVTTTQAYLNITATTKYRAVVKSGTCASANSAAATITIDPATVAGSVTADATVCSGSNGATLTLAGHTGSIVKWQSSTDNFVTPVDIANVTTTQAYLNITATTKYRAVVKSGTCASANSAAATITVDPPTVAGSVTADATVCSGANGATLTLAGHTGSIVKWQSSTDNFVTPVDIANVTTTQTYLNITTTTKYRAVVKSGTCASANSAAATITIDPATVAGSVTADATVCSGSNGATLTLAGHTGSIVKWQSSTDNFVTPVDIANITTTQAYLNITATTKYRAVVKSGTCASANSAAATITVDPATVAGSVTADATVCSGANGATLTLAGHTGSIVKWQRSTDNFVTPIDIANATTTQAYLNITTTTKYRAIVKSGTCTSANSAAATITVDPASASGTVSSDATVCSGANGATLTLAGHTGSIIKWQRSTDNFVTPVDIANVTTSQAYSNITATTKYRAIIQSGACPAANSAAATITVDPATVGGSVTADATVCSGANTGTLTLSGNTGTVSNWESSTDNFITKTTIANVATSQAYANITATTKYRAVVKSGTCASDISAAATITVDPVSVGGTVSADATVCSGANGATLTLAGYTGTITGWQSSTDNFVTKTAIANLTASQPYSNITATTKYRAVVKSGTCSSANSSSSTITVDPVSVGGTVTADATVCSGANTGTLTLAGNTGSVTGWESSTDNFITKTTIANATTSQPYLNITTTTKYRAVVKSGTCASDNSAAATITIDPVSVGGTVAADAMVCLGANGATLTLAGYTGAITGWESSTDNFVTKNSIANTTASQAYSNITETTKYRAVVKSGTCSSANSADATITIDPIAVSIENDTICDKTSTIFNAGPGFTTYTWSGAISQIGQSIIATTGGKYIITVTDGLGCTATDSAVLVINTIPTPNFSNDTVYVCSGSTVLLDPGTANNLTYMWSSLQTTPTIATGIAGQYIVTVSDAIGCSNKDTVVVKVNALPNVSLGNDITICDNGYDELTLTAQYSGNYQLNWSTSQSNVKSIVITESGSYWVQVSDSNKCSLVDTIEVTAYCEDLVFTWPNVLTPNGDGQNDVFKPIGVDDSNFQKVVANVHIISFGVYDRWGRFMFYSEENILPNWDGKFNGSPAASGTYFYVIKYRNSAGKYYEISNYMTLME